MLEGEPISMLYECSRCKQTKPYGSPDPVRVNLGRFAGKLLCVECAEEEEKIYYKEV